MVQADVKRYLLGGEPSGSVLELRGHGTLFAHICVLVGVVVSVLAALCVYALVKKPNDENALGLAIAAGLAGPSLIIGALWRLRHPDRVIVVDRSAQTLQVTAHGRKGPAIRFVDLGTMSLRSIGYTVNKTGFTRHGSVPAVGLTDHPEVILYEPATDRDLVRFCATLRELVGEHYLPRAEKRPRPAP